MSAGSGRTKESGNQTNAVKDLMGACWWAIAAHTMAWEAAHRQMCDKIPNVPTASNGPASRHWFKTLQREQRLGGAEWEGWSLGSVRCGGQRKRRKTEAWWAQERKTGSSVVGEKGKNERKNAARQGW